eukprot:TRINITY_DN5942_c2_g6_i1.p1 TRINITY_DN5942_c2_g6~~TRINITY_DN5942_c2_g6_i1.p1  ORF type:complete len:109 (+),score=7.41 TRINITY_DN5942_c2_g6_i1:30-329(+)
MITWFYSNKGAGLSLFFFVLLNFLFGCFPLVYVVYGPAMGLRIAIGLVGKQSVFIEMRLVLWSTAIFSFLLVLPSSFYFNDTWSQCDAHIFIKRRVNAC